MKKEYKVLICNSGFDIQHRCDLHRFWIDWELFYEIWNEICV